MKISGGRCQCAECGAYFNRVSTFDRHRIGDFAKPGESDNTRRCLAELEMAAKGWRKNETGWWVTGGGFWKRAA